MTERSKAWQCIGCGRIESQATCLGICEDRPVLLVSAADYDQAQRQRDQLRLFVRQLALISPRGDNWERTYKALHERARRLLDGFDLSQDAIPGARQAA
jgi:hypothetical protein